MPSTQLDDGQAALIDNVPSLGGTLRLVFSLIRKNKYWFSDERPKARRNPIEAGKNQTIEIAKTEMIRCLSSQQEARGFPQKLGR